MILVNVLFLFVLFLLLKFVHLIFTITTLYETIFVTLYDETTINMGRRPKFEGFSFILK